MLLNYVKSGYISIHEYTQTRFEKLYTNSGEVLSTRKHKAITSKSKQNIFITIDQVEVFKGITKYNMFKVYNDLYNSNND